MLTFGLYIFRHFSQSNHDDTKNVLQNGTGWK